MATREERLQEPVAIVGLSALFAEAENLTAYWENVVAGKDCIVDVPPSRWLVGDHYDPDPSVPDRTYCKRGGFVPEVDFDPLEWGLPPNSLEVTDVAQLLSLVLAKRAFADAGYGSDGRPFDRERTGVVLGVGGGQKLITPLTSRLQEPVWRRALETSGVSGAAADLIVAKIAAAYVGWQEESFPGMLGNVIAGRIANRFDLGGINCVVDAACAASLAALRMALGELAEDRADLMLTGGVDADNSPFMYLCFSKTPAFSPANRIRPFDASSDGMMVGEGLGMLVLKRLADAERDGDRVYAVIRGLGASSDGRFKSIYAPRSSGQERALGRAYAAAGIAPESVGLLEAHGTGTAAGDVCEVEALLRVFDADGRGHGSSIALGSVKSQIGHTKAAAGAAGLIKAALALHHKVLPPTINVERPNDALGLDGSPFYLNTEARPWLRRAPDAPRRAGVSAFGFGGTNFHVVLEEHEREQQRGPYRLHGSVREVLLTADTPEELAARCAEGAVGGIEEAPDEAPRLGFVAASDEECAELLRLAAERLRTDPDAEAWRLPAGIHYRRRAFAGCDRIAALFPGQGSQYVGMGRAIGLAFPPVREAFAAADALHVAAGERPLSDTVYPPPAFDDAGRAAQEELLRATARAQPAIGALSMAMLTLLRNAGLAPQFAAGHSFGELTALWAAAAIEDADLLRLARERGTAMSVPAGTDAGTMLAVTGDAAAVGDAVAGLGGVQVANVNAPDQTVIAGPTDEIEDARQLLADLGYPTTPLPVSAAFHTPLVAHAQAPFAEAVRATALRPPRIPVFANATGEPYPGEAGLVADQLARQLAQPVQWARQVEGLYAAGARVFVEVGPKSVLTRLVERILGDRPHVAIALDDGRSHGSDRPLRDGVVQLRVLGVRLGDIDPYRRSDLGDAVDAAAGRLRIRLDGANYVSEKTRAAYAAVLAERVPVESEQEETTSMSTNGSHRATASELAAALSSGPPDAPGDVVAQLLRLQQQLVAGQLELARALLEQGSSGTPPSDGVLDAVQRQQAAMLHQHEAFVAALLATQAGRPAPAPERPPAPPVAPVAPPPAPPALAEPAPPPIAAAAPPAAPDLSSPTGDPVAELAAAMLEVVSEKTGYPVETLELDMDMEADLGIDSIKRVEILGAMQARFDDLPEVRPEELAALRTLQEVVDYMREGAERLPSSAAEDAVALAFPRLRPLPPPDELDVELPEGFCALLTDDGTELTAALARELLARGRPTVVLRFPGSLVPRDRPLPADAAEVLLDVADEAQIARILADVADRHGPIGAFVHLHPRDPQPGFVSPEQEELVRAVFLASTGLRDSLERSAARGRGSFVVVTRLDGALGTSGGDADPAGAGLYGLAKTIRSEWPSVFCRAIDIAPSVAPEAAVRAVLAELADPDERLVEVGYGPEGRVTLAAGGVAGLRG